MGEQERPGEQDAYKWRGGVDEPEPDAEGHAKFRATGEPEADEPPQDSSEDTEGHKRFFRAGEGTDQPPQDSSEDRVTDQPEPGTDEQDTEGHGRGRS